VSWEAPSWYRGDGRATWALRQEFDSVSVETPDAIARKRFGSALVPSARAPAGIRDGLPPFGLLATVGR